MDELQRIDIIKRYKNGESMNKISQSLDINISSVSHVIHKSDLKVLSISEQVNKRYNKSNLKFNDEVEQILIGNLLGDGNLRVTKHGIRPQYTHTDKHEEYIKWLKLKLEQTGITFTTDKRIHNGCFQIQTHTYDIFKDLYDKFYSEQKRIVPEDIKLTPIVFRQWFISDGSNASGSRGKYISKVVENPSFLISKIESVIGKGISYHRDKKTGYGKFYIPAGLSRRFLNYIGECPVECYKYKWK